MLKNHAEHTNIIIYRTAGIKMCECVYTLGPCVRIVTTRYGDGRSVIIQFGVVQRRPRSYTHYAFAYRAIRSSRAISVWSPLTVGVHPPIRELTVRLPKTVVPGENALPGLYLYVLDNIQLNNIVSNILN